MPGFAPLQAELAQIPMSGMYACDMCWSWGGCRSSSEINQPAKLNASPAVCRIPMLVFAIELASLFRWLSAAIADEYRFITWAGQAGLSESNSGVKTNAQFNEPEGLALDKAANLLIADYGNAVIRKVTPDGVVSRLVGWLGFHSLID